MKTKKKLFRIAEIWQSPETDFLENIYDSTPLENKLPHTIQRLINILKPDGSVPSSLRRHSSLSNSEQFGSFRERRQSKNDLKQ